MAYNLRYKFMGFPEDALPQQGTTFIATVTEVAPLGDGEIEVTLEFEDVL